MPHRSAVVMLICVVACSRQEGSGGDTGTPAQAPPPAPAGIAGPVTDSGIGPIRIGMTVADARTAVPGFQAGTGGCEYASVPGLPSGVSAMIENGVVVRVDVDSGSVATVEGARVGDSEATVRQLYGNRVTVSPHKYTAGRYLTVRLPVPRDTLRRLIFETDTSKVVRFRVGKLPQVAYVERCG